MRGKLIIVGGHSRHVGKTTLVARILDALRPAPWTAIKVSSHSHRPRAGRGDTGAEAQASRYLLAGAVRALLVRAADEAIAETAAEVRRLIAAGENVIVESNRLAACCRADAVLFVVAPDVADWKGSSDGCVERAHALVISGRASSTGPEHPRLRDQSPPLPRFRVAPESPGGELREWLWARLQA